MVRARPHTMFVHVLRFGVLKVPPNGVPKRVNLGDLNPSHPVEPYVGVNEVLEPFLEVCSPFLAAL